MTHLIVTHATADDQFAPAAQPGDTTYVFAFNGTSEGISIHHTVASEIERAGLNLSSTAEDLLNFAMTAYSADMRVPRSTGYDSWTRGLRLYLAVTNLDQWVEARDELTELLSYLTGDHWEIEFRQRNRETEVAQVEKSQKQLIVEAPTAVALFSGGLDSFIGAIENLEANKGPIVLVGHHGAGTTNRVQERAFAAINAKYSDRATLLRFYVQPDTPVEKTTRSRSIVFLALGAAVASAYEGPITLSVPENGLISLNPPLTDTRMGSLSTRTTHPYFLSLFSSVLTRLGINVALDAPYRFVTKGEMIERVKNNEAFLSGVHDTLSCSHPDVGRYQGNSPGQHCGYCFPCLIRRAALDFAGLDDRARYLDDVRTNRPAQGSDTGRDLRALEMAIRRFKDMTESRRSFEVLASGPLPSAEASNYVGVYRRGMEELRLFFEGPSTKT